VEHGYCTGSGFCFYSKSLTLPAITGITITETGEEEKGARSGMVVPEGAWRFHDMRV